MDSEPSEMVTGCGRRLSVGRFQLPSTRGRVVLRIDPTGDCADTVWASLTPDEATALAHTLLAQARVARGGTTPRIFARQVIPPQRPGGRRLSDG
ncbi:hypothetical protein [Actinophytocola xanthii]|uniref:hypothetical protein n=1 Tax=Actinophytocola xanthii TaxID=1912961 RepID=UPI00117737CC|nr:hypothetical protein [Actinophytocola xanthii]